MTDSALNTRAKLLRSLHDDLLVLPNAWDAASAALLAAAGAKAVATTSGGVAWSVGHPDGQQLGRDAMVEVVRRIVATVDVPVTADIEGGYGPDASDVAATIAAVVGVGAAGVNLEDSRSPGALFELDEQVDRLRAARTAATDNGAPDLVVNARTDVFLFGIGEPEGRLDEVLRRAAGYADAGADCLFVPGLLDLDVLAKLTGASPLPVNAMAGAGGPSVAELHAAGVRRISVGTGIAQAAYTTARKAAEELLTAGTFGTYEGALPFPELNGLFRRATG